MTCAKKLLLAFILLTFAGCGSSSNGFVATGPGTLPPAQTSDILVRFTLLQQAVPAEVTDFRFTGRSAAGNTIYGPVERAKAGEVLLENVPVAVVFLNIQYLNGATVVGTGEMPVQLQAGGSLTVENPPFLPVEPVDPIEIVSMEILPNPAMGAPGSQKPLICRGLLGDGSTVELTDQVTWSSNDDGIAQPNASGVVTATGDKGQSTTITASLPNSSVASATVSFHVEQYFYISSLLPGRIDGFKIQDSTREITQFSPLFGLRQASVREPIVHPSARFYYYLNQNRLMGAAINPVNGRLTALVAFDEALAGFIIEDFSLHPDGTALYATDGKSNVITIPLDPGTGLVNGSPQAKVLELEPLAVAIHPSGTFLYVQVVDNQLGFTEQCAVFPIAEDESLGTPTRVDNALMNINSVVDPAGRFLWSPSSQFDPIIRRYSIDGNGLPVVSMSPQDNEVDLSPDSLESLVFSADAGQVYGYSANNFPPAAVAYTVTGTGDLTPLGFPSTVPENGGPATPAIDYSGGVIVYPDDFTGGPVTFDISGGELTDGQTLPAPIVPYQGYDTIVATP